MLSRRSFVQGCGGLAVATTGIGAYACGIEPGLELFVTRYHLTPPGWPDSLRLDCAIIADIHACEPWMSVSRIRDIVTVTNTLAPDLTVLLGDFNAGHGYVTGAVYPPQWGEVLADLKAPLGVYSVLGNHDWWHGALPGTKGHLAQPVRTALKDAHITVLENKAVRVSSNGQPFWIAGLADQIAISLGAHHHRGLDDLDGTLAQVTDDAPILLLAHEPYVFPRVPQRVSLTLCGHTHGGQVDVPLISPWYEHTHLIGGYVYGHVVEGGRHMLISGGLGTSYAPVRFLRPPEIVLLTLGGGPNVSA